jgi:EmrB/QacA subfamily drug resistance transporter
VEPEHAPAALAPDLPAPVVQRRYVIFALVSVALFMSSIDQTIVATAMPAIHRSLHAAINWSSWTITIYSLGRVLVLPLVGRVGDHLGRRLTFMIAITIFTVASLLCGLASSIYMLVALRLVQALGGGAFIPSATGIVSDCFGRDRDRAVGLFSSITPIGAIVGPVLGGLFVTYWSWRGIFLINVPIGILLVTLGLRYIPPGSPETSAAVDLPGIGLLAVTLLAGMAAISYLGEAHAALTSPYFIGPVCLAAVGLGLVLRHAARDPDAIVPLRLLRGNGYGVMNLINFLYGSAALGFGALVPLYAQDRYQVASLAAGTLLVARAVGMIGVAGLAAFALRRTGYRAPMITGFLTSATGITMMALSPPGSFGVYLWLALAAAITGLGMGLALPASNNASLQIDPTQVAAVSGLRSTFRQIGSISAISVTTMVAARSTEPGLGQAHVFLGFAAFLVLAAPLTLLVPEHRDAW